MNLQFLPGTFVPLLSSILWGVSDCFDTVAERVLKQDIKVASIATRSTVTSLIKMLCLLWKKGCIHQLKSLGATKILSSLVMVSYLFGSAFKSRHLNKLSQNKLSKANSFSPYIFLAFIQPSLQLHNDIRLLKETSN